MLGERRGLGSQGAREGAEAKDCVSLTNLQKAEKLRSALQAKAKGSPTDGWHGSYR